MAKMDSLPNKLTPPWRNPRDPKLLKIFIVSHNFMGQGFDPLAPCEVQLSGVLAEGTS